MTLELRIAQCVVIYLDQQAHWNDRNRLEVKVNR